MQAARFRLRGFAASPSGRKLRKKLLLRCWGTGRAACYKEQSFFCFFFVHKKEDSSPPGALIVRRFILAPRYGIARHPAAG